MPGGVLSRTGHTEGSTDLCRLAGLTESAVICEVMNEDGTMARKKALIDFSKKHNLKIGTIADLINYRIFNEQTVKRLESKSVKTEYGRFNLILYKDLIFEETHIVLQKGRISKNTSTLVRVQQSNLYHDLLNIDEFGTRWSISLGLNATLLPTMLVCSIYDPFLCYVLHSNVPCAVLKYIGNSN